MKCSAVVWAAFALATMAGCGRSELDVALPCYAPVADCNGLRADGCETNVLSDADHCGRCGVQCASGLSCGGGACVPPTQPVQVETNGGVDFVRTAGGTVFAWGFNRYGMTLTAAEHELQAVVLDLPPLAEVRASSFSACGRTFDGRVLCWGNWVPGRPDALAPAAAFIPAINQAVRLTSWHYGHCALEALGDWKCWDAAAEYHHSLAIGAGESVTYPLAEPVTMAALPGFGRDVVTGVAVMADGSVWGWGRPRSAGQPDFLDPPYINVVDPPALLPFAPGASRLYGSHSRVCVTTTDGVICWGAMVESPTSPHFVALPAARYQRVTPSLYHLCGLRDDHRVVCNNTILDIEKEGIADIASVDREFLVVTLDGKVYCLDVQAEGNCATGSMGFVNELVEVPLPSTSQP